MRTETSTSQGFGEHLKMMQSTPDGRHPGWLQGEHILISGPTSAGKTTLASKLIPIRKHVVMFVSKMKDPTFEQEFKGWTRLTKWPKGGPKPYEEKVLLWPEIDKGGIRATQRKQHDVFLTALNHIAQQGNRCVVIDEALYMTDPKILNLGTEVGALHYTGRSAGISMVTLTQRPAWIPKVIYSSVSHAYVARTRDREDMKRLADLGGIDAREYGAVVGSLLDRHDYAYANPQGDMPATVVNTRH